MVRLVPTPQSVRSGMAAILPVLDGRAEVEFMGPAVAGLLMREPVGFSDRRRFCQTVRRNIAGLDAFRCLHALMDRFAVDSGVDQEMYDMDILRPEFARHRLGYRAKSELCGGECRKTQAATDAGGCSRKEDGAATARKHVARRLAAAQKPAVTSKL